MICSFLYNLVKLQQIPAVKSYLSNKNGNKRYITEHMKKAVEKFSKPKQHFSTEKLVKFCRKLEKLRDECLI